MSQESIEKLRALTAQLNQYRYEYYGLNAPTVSDEVYDRLFDELDRLERELCVRMCNSPTITVGWFTMQELKKATHTIPLLSLDKTKKADELCNFIGDQPVMLMPKLNIVHPNEPEGLTLLLWATSLNSAVKKLRYSAEFQLPAAQYILFRFIIRNSPQYADMRWGRLPPVNAEALYDNMVYHINTIPGEAAARKGHADYPEDFPHLRPGEDFTAWRNGRQLEIETTLNGDALLDRLKALKQQDTRAQTQELQYIFSFATEGCFDTEVACDQLRSLWTAYCLRYGLVVDTHRYDSDLSAVWARVAADGSDTAFWSDFDSFDNYMCANLL